MYQKKHIYNKEKLKQVTSTVVFFISGKNLKNKIFSINGQNPGVGGTEFCTITLALNLANDRADYQVYLCTEVLLNSKNFPKNFKQILIRDFLDCKELFCFEKTIFICPDGLLANKELLKKLVKYKLVNWIHHPFRIPTFYKNFKFSAHVSVGTYQYFSNNVWYNPHWHISNLFNIIKFNKLPKNIFKPKKGLRLVFLGVLVPGKGFHNIAKNWKKIKKRFSKVRLDVIGSTKTYTGKKSENKVIPTSNDYAKKILKYIEKDDLKKKLVVFHGNLGEEKFKIIKKAHFAILNPTGRTEAFPASVLECLMCGTPVITADDYGMSDFMSYFPETSLKSPNQIPEKLVLITNNSVIYSKLRKQSLFIARLFSKKNSKNLLKWEKLIDSLILNKKIKNNPPTQLFKGNKFYLIIRILIRSIIVILKLVLNKLY